MKIIYRNEVFEFIHPNFTRPGFKHNFLLFINEQEQRKAYSVQMAVNYISTLPVATFDQNIDEQTFVACIPIAEYPELLEFLNNNGKGVNLYKLTDNLANSLIVSFNYLLNSNKEINDKQLFFNVDKLSQYVKLLEIDKLEKPKSVSSFDDLYHIYLNKQRVFKDSLKFKLQIRSLMQEVEFLLALKGSPNYLKDTEDKFIELEKLMNQLEKYNYIWYEDFINELNILKRKIKRNTL